MKLDHIAIAVLDLASAIQDFERLGWVCARVEAVPSEQSHVAFFDLGGVHVELVAPLFANAEGAPIARSLAQRGEGLHHLCVEVDNLPATMQALSAAGLRLLSTEPKPGAGGSRVAFVHPKSLHGVLLELVQKTPTEID